jgi:hypothetical protein
MALSRWGILRVAGFLSLALPTVVLASVDHIVVEGIAYDEQMGRLRHVTIGFTSTETDFARTTVSDSRGYFRLADLRRGLYRIQVRAEGQLLLEQDYRIGENIMENDRGEEIVIRVGVGVLSLGPSPPNAEKGHDATPKGRRRSPSASSYKTLRNANLILGSRALDEDKWGPIEDHTIYGISIDARRATWPVSVVLGFSTSSEDGNESLVVDDIRIEGWAESTIWEASIGVAKIWDTSGQMRPFVGGGISAVRTDLEAVLESPDIDGSARIDEDDTSLGLYVEGGIVWQFKADFNLGFSGRILIGTELELVDEETDVDYGQFAVILGWGW